MCSRQNNQVGCDMIRKIPFLYHIPIQQIFDAHGMRFSDKSANCVIAVEWPPNLHSLHIKFYQLSNFTKFQRTIIAMFAVRATPKQNAISFVSFGSLRSISIFCGLIRIIRLLYGVLRMWVSQNVFTVVQIGRSSWTRFNSPALRCQTPP